jgi:hypothetical protein
MLASAELSQTSVKTVGHAAAGLVRIVRMPPGCALPSGGGPL